MPLYQCQPPTGYKDTGDAWTNTGALVGRMNFALALANGRMPPPAPGERRGGPLGAQDPGAFRGRGGAQQALERRFVNDGPAAVATWEASVESALGNDLSETTRATIGKAGEAPQRVALALGSPEFQKR